MTNRMAPLAIAVAAGLTCLAVAWAPRAPTPPPQPAPTPVPALTAAPTPTPAPKPPIKVGRLTELTGGYAFPGKEDTDGMLLAFDEIRYEIAGRKVEVVIEDTAAVPALALTKARKLVELDKVHVLTGIIWSPTAVAIRDYVCLRAKIPYVSSVTGVRMLTQEGRCPYIFRGGFSSGQEMIPYGKYAYEKHGFRKMAIYAFDSIFGREQAAYFKKAFEESGGKIVLEIFAPVGAPDHAPYLTRIKAAKVDAVAAWWAGSQAIRFIKQFKEYGLKDEVRIIGLASMTDEALFEALGDDALGVGTVAIYSPELDNPENRRFVASHISKYGRRPGMMSEYGYTAARIIIQAAKTINGAVEDTDRFVRALEKVDFMAPRGGVRFDEFHNPIHTIVMREVRRVNGRLANAVIDTIPDVEQYWPAGKPKS